MMKKLLTAVFLTTLACSLAFANLTSTTSAPVVADKSVADKPERPVANQAIPGKPAKKMPIIIPAAPLLDVSAYTLLDADSGDTLAAQDTDKRLEPASLTKMMTAYVIDQAIANGRIQRDQLVPISEKAWRMEGSRMFVKVNTEVPVADLLKGVIIQSGNDASVALAEFIAGTEEAFSDLMNQEAQRLGMTNTHFMNATGLPDDNHYTTAHDLAILARALIKDFPESYPLYAEKWFSYNNIKQSNRNLLLWRDNTVDGIKTGHTDAAGYCLVSSAKRGDMRLIAVILGAKSSNARAEQSSKLLTYGFRFYETHKVYAANTSVSTPRVWMGQAKQVAVGLNDDLYITIPRGEYSHLSAALNLPDIIKAPVEQHKIYGNLVLTLDGKTVAEKPLVALESVVKGGWWKNTQDYIKLSFKKFWDKDEGAGKAEKIALED